jgi:uncharacterized membrane protein YhhN
VIILLILIFAILEWIGEVKGYRMMKYIFKPSVSFLFLVWMISEIGYFGSYPVTERLQIIGFITAFGCCLLGDIFFILPEKCFLPGLSAFLLGHLSLIVGFGRIIPRDRDIVPGLVLLVLLCVLSVSILQKLKISLQKQNLIGLQIPVGVYSSIITLMLYSALLTLFGNQWDFQSSFLVSMGALSFYFSDVLNAWMRFVRKIEMGKVKAMATYHLALFFLATGILMHYNG